MLLTEQRPGYVLETPSSAPVIWVAHRANSLEDIKKGLSDPRTAAFERDAQSPNGSKYVVGRHFQGLTCGALNNDTPLEELDEAIPPEYAIIEDLKYFREAAIRAPFLRHLDRMRADGREVGVTGGKRRFLRQIAETRPEHTILWTIKGIKDIQELAGPYRDYVQVVSVKLSMFERVQREMDPDIATFAWDVPVQQEHTVFEGIRRGGVIYDGYKHRK